MAKAATHRPPTVHIVLDTNCLFTEAADKLIANELSGFIREESRALGIDVKWYLPAVVKAERRHQMLQRGLGLLIPFGKLEALLGHQLNMTPDILAARVDEAIQRQITSHSLEVRELDTAQVDWNWIIDRAVTRQPPFEPGEREKGFRDALVLETYVQLLNELPKTPTIARVVLLSDDDRLQQAARERAGGVGSATVEPDLGAIRTLLNAIASHLNQEAISDIVSKARLMFFDKAKLNESLYYKFNLHHWNQRPEVQALPDPSFTLGKSHPVVGATTFLSKHRQALEFSTQVTVRRTVIRRVPRPTGAGLLGGSPSELSYFTLDDAPRASGEQTKPPSQM